MRRGAGHTTATDVNGLFAVDLWAKAQNCAVLEPERIKRVSGALLAGQTVGCIAMFVLAFLVSPFGLPALGGWLVERLHGVKYAAMDFMAS